MIIQLEAVRYRGESVQIYTRVNERIVTTSFMDRTGEIYQTRLPNSVIDSAHREELMTHLDALERLELEAMREHKRSAEADEFPRLAAMEIFHAAVENNNSQVGPKDRGHFYYRYTERIFYFEVVYR